MVVLPLRYKIHDSRGNLYIWLTETTIGIAPSYEEWEEINKQGDRLIGHAKHQEKIEKGGKNGNLSTRDREAATG